jgi:uncharacterized protein YdeI (YjbR/CyaY-like superfamily)
MASKPTFFPAAAAFRAWLAEHHATESELLVGFYNARSKKRGISYKEAVDQALCFGWIDGVRRSVDGERYVQRFTPRQKRSTWSAVNIARVEELKAAGLMAEAGLAAFARRTGERSRIYSFESAPRTLSAEQERTLRADRRAWAFWESQPPGYRRIVVHWLASAKREPTRERRLALLVECCTEGRRLPQLTPSPRRQS